MPQGKFQLVIQLLVIFGILSISSVQIWTALAQEEPSIVINEIAYRGTQASSMDEWIELYNSTFETINLSGWSLLLSSKVIPLVGSIPAHGYFLLERTDDSTVSDIPADQIYKGSLSDAGTTIQLLDPGGSILDQISRYPIDLSNPPQGFSERSSIERISPYLSGDLISNWRINDQEMIHGVDVLGNRIYGTPRGQNSISVHAFGYGYEGIRSLSIEDLKKLSNLPPRAVITLQGKRKLKGCRVLHFNPSAEDSSDPDGDPLSYTWVYRDKSHQVLHTDTRENPTDFKFTEEMGEFFSVSLSVTDSFGWSDETKLDLELRFCAGKKRGEKPALQTPYQYSRNIIISEVFPNPFGKDEGVEFIELFNTGSTPVRLHGWKLVANNKKKKLDGLSIAPKGFLAFHKAKLLNSRSVIELLDPDEISISSVSYSEPEEGKSYSIDQYDNFRWTQPTPGQRNEFPFNLETIYVQGLAQVVITRFLANPRGKDYGREWIEIQNRSDHSIQLLNWQLDNREGGSSPFRIPDLLLRQRQTHKFFSSDTGITLRNTADEIRILDPQGQLLDKVVWDTPMADGVIYKRSDLIQSTDIEPDMADVIRVVDGDTIDVLLRGEKERVRLIGVDTPETVHPFKPLERFGKEASNYSKSQLDGQKIRLEYDLIKRGKYGRLLAYVYVKDPDMITNKENDSWRHFNAELIEKGYAFAYLKYPFKYREIFRQLEVRAQEQGLGLWQSDEIKKIQAEQETVIDDELEDLEILEEIIDKLGQEKIEEESSEIEKTSPIAKRVRNRKAKKKLKIKNKRFSNKKNKKEKTSKKKKSKKQKRAKPLYRVQEQYREIFTSSILHWYPMKKLVALANGQELSIPSQYMRMAEVLLNSDHQIRYTQSDDPRVPKTLSIIPDAKAIDEFYTEQQEEPIGNFLFIGVLLFSLGCWGKLARLPFI